VDQPRSLYAATKAAELMAYTYAQLYGLPPPACASSPCMARGAGRTWHRCCSRAVLAGRPIDVFNEGRMQRDFTHVSDIVSGILGALAHPADGPVPHRVFNLGNHTPVELERFISVIEQAPAAPRRRSTSPCSPATWCARWPIPGAHMTLSASTVTPIEEGLPPVVQWCREYFGDRAPDRILTPRVHLRITSAAENARSLSPLAESLMSQPELSVVVPVFNERQRRPLVAEITAALRGRLPFEIVYIDDHSRDDTLAVLQGLKATTPELGGCTSEPERAEQPQAPALASRRAVDRHPGWRWARTIRPISPSCWPRAMPPRRR
jgi:hypothetical protein